MASLNSVNQWDREVDILIVGYGLSGAVTAIEAHDTDPDAEILVIDKCTERFQGGSSRASGQTLWCPKDVDATVEYQRALNYTNPVDDSLLRVWAEAMATQEEWIEERAVEADMEYVRRSARPGADPKHVTVEFEELPGAKKAVSYNSTIIPGPAGVWEAFRKNVEKRPRIERQFETAALDFVQDPDTLEIFGVIVERDGRRQAYKARKGVVMATGSFEGSMQMQRDFWGAEEIYALGNPENTGDGIRMMQKAGAELWHMRNFTQTGGLQPAIKVPEYKGAFFRQQFMEATSWLDIAADGKRFYDEGVIYAYTHYRMKKHGNWVDVPTHQVLPIHMIMDETTRLAQPLVALWKSWNIVVEGYEWSEDNSKEVEKGWITRADTIRELAVLIGRDPDLLEDTVNRYNEAARAGVDPEFGREADRMTPIENGPFYAIKVVPGVVAHTGGARRDEKSRVVTHESTPIPRLYEVGEMGSIFSNIYQNGGFLAECIAFGRIAARNVLAETPL
ncbi:FAD-binding protein [Nocardioides sp. W7]|uniref:FAD-dependent oxidoreductase n=1 Tax=Nocardioides sp. W7 TaxID=2931390 RepID=UPI001FD2A3AC|nr:FAD-binding protein [Nocardioides sp. W7]